MYGAAPRQPGHAGVPKDVVHGSGLMNVSNPAVARSLVVTAIITLLLAANSHAAMIFCNDFEDGNRLDCMLLAKIKR